MNFKAGQIYYSPQLNELFLVVFSCWNKLTFSHETEQGGDVLLASYERFIYIGELL
jgi:hypothetical protein